MRRFISEICIGFEAAFSPSASIPPRVCKCHGGADDDGCVLSCCRQSRDAAVLRPKERRLSIAPVSVKSCLSARLWCTEPLQLALPLSMRQNSKLYKYISLFKGLKIALLSAGSLCGSLFRRFWLLQMEGSGVSQITSNRVLALLAVSGQEPWGNAVVIRCII